MFKEGQKIIAIQNHPDNLFQKGNIFVVEDVTASKCSCHSFLVNIGMHSNPYFYHSCLICKNRFKHNDMIRWFSNTHFAPVEHAYADLLMEDLKKEKTIEELEIIETI